MIKTYRGILDDGGQDKIRLSTKKGKVGYKIVKFQIIRHAQTASIDHVVKIFKVEQSSVPSGSATIDLADGNMLGVVALSGTAFGEINTTIIFEQEIFNQDVYITHTDNDGSDACNYYLELETVSLSDNATLVSTLRDVRLNPQVAA